MTTKQTSRLIIKTAKAVRKEFKKAMPEGKQLVEINWSLPYLAVNLPDGKEYFFQGQEASEMLQKCVETSNMYNVGVEDTILFLSQSW